MAVLRDHSRQRAQTNVLKIDLSRFHRLRKLLDSAGEVFAKSIHSGFKTFYSARVLLGNALLRPKQQVKTYRRQASIFPERGTGEPDSGSGWWWPIDQVFSLNCCALEVLSFVFVPCSPEKSLIFASSLRCSFFSRFSLHAFWVQSRSGFRVVGVIFCYCAWLKQLQLFNQRWMINLVSSFHAFILNVKYIMKWVLTKVVLSLLLNITWMNWFKKNENSSSLWVSKYMFVH